MCVSRQIVALFFVILFDLSATNAQNYRTIRQGTTFYTSESHPFPNYNKIINAIRIDSIAVVGLDTMFFNFPQIRDVGGCVVPGGPSWIGKGMLAKSDGSNSFFNIDGDTITIKTLAAVGDSWTMYRYKDGWSIKAEVMAKDTGTFLSITDSVKTLKLQVVDTKGASVSHAVNAIEIKLSKHYGFIRFPNFIWFPRRDIRRDVEDFTHIDQAPLIYHISGVDAPITGVSGFSMAEAFNLQPGDEFHVYSEGNYSLNFQYDFRQQDIFKVLTRIDSGDRLFLTLENTNYYKNVIPQQGFSDWKYSKYTILKNIVKDTMSSLPQETVFDKQGYRAWGNVMYINSNGDVLLANPSFEKKLCLNNGCLETCVTHGMPVYNTYISGLGGPYYYYYEASGISQTRKLVYYKKGNKEWGTPIGIDEPKEQPFALEIYPNPASNSATLKMPESFTGQLSILNTLGQEVYHTSVNQEQIVAIDLYAFPAGVYIISLVGNNRQGIARLVKE